MIFINLIHLIHIHNRGNKKLIKGNAMTKNEFELLKKICGYNYSFTWHLGWPNMDLDDLYRTVDQQRKNRRRELRLVKSLVRKGFLKSPSKKSHLKYYYPNWRYIKSCPELRVQIGLGLFPTTIK